MYLQYRHLFLYACICVVMASHNFSTKNATECFISDTIHLEKNFNVCYYSRQLWKIDLCARILPTCVEGVNLNYETLKTNELYLKQLPADSMALIIRCPSGFYSPEFEESINNGSLRMFTELTLFDIKYCQLHTLSNLSFRGLLRLTTIWMKDVGLFHIDPDFLQHVPQLVFLVIDGNNLTTLDPNIFCDNKRLTFLEIQRNQIGDLDGRDTKANVSCLPLTIDSLVVDGNPLYSLPNNSFKQYQLTGVLSISNCSLNKLSNNAFAGNKYVIAIDMSFNNISKLSKGVFAPMGRTLKYLNLTNNKIVFLEIPTDLYGLQGLVLLDLTANSLDMIKGNFSSLPMLEEIYLSCNLLTEIYDNQFSFMGNVQKIYLKQNEIQNISTGAFKHSKVVHMDLSYNKLALIDRKLFSNLRYMTVLNLSNNLISVVENNSFENCSNLTTLDLSNNLLSRLDALFLIGAENLRVLNISNNAIININSTAFHSNKSLTTTCTNRLQIIRLSNNHVSHIPKSLFYNKCPSFLNIVDLMINNISSLDGVFENMNNMTELYGRGNNLTNIPKELIFSNVSLEILDFGQNSLEHIVNRSLGMLSNLTALSLDNNYIKTVKTDALNGLPHLHYLTLSANNFPCTCDILSLKNWITTHSSIHMDNITCKTISAKGVVEVLIKSLNLTNCEPIDSEKATILKVTLSVGSLIVLMCLVSILVFKYRYEIQVIFLYKCGIRVSCFYRKSRARKHYQYDAFVCFSQEDDSFVLNELRPFLEQTFKLCIPYRDFEAGRSIVENIIEMIEESNRIIIVLSEAFLQSRWGQFEFNAARHSAIQSLDKKLIVIVMEDSVLKAEHSLTLRSILRTKVYLHRNDKLFWEKIMFAMPEKKEISHISESMESLINSENTQN